MVVERGNTTNSDLSRRKFEEYIALFGRSDITLKTFTRTTNSEGRLSTVSVSTSTISGDLQFDRKLMSEYVRDGVAITGDGVFFTPYSVSINDNDEIIVDSVTWKLVTQVEGETIGTGVDYQGWIARRK